MHPICVACCNPRCIALHFTISSRSVRTHFLRLGVFLENRLCFHSGIAGLISMQRTTAKSSMTDQDLREIRVFFSRSNRKYNTNFVRYSCLHTASIHIHQWPLSDPSSPSLLSFPLRKHPRCNFVVSLVLTIFPSRSAVIGITLTTSFGFASARDVQPVRRLSHSLENHHRL